VLRERVSEDIYVFTSDLYAQVTAGAIITDQGVILVDSLPFPEEAHEMQAFVTWVCQPGVRYVILTHYHADHTYGAFLFPQADVVAHARCRQLLDTVGLAALDHAKAEVPILEEVFLRLPDITFEEGEIALCLGGRLMRLIHAPGHTEDSVMVYVEDERVLFAADTMMPVPSIVDGDIDMLRESLQKITALPVENMVQGHGEVILRGEVKSMVDISLAYLDSIEKLVARALKKDRRGGKREGWESLTRNSIESCGLSRIPLNGIVQQIHVANLLALYDRQAA
jgi:cyclase